MKKFLSNPVVALILTIIVVCGSTVVNTRVKLGKIAVSVCNAKMFHKRSHFCAAGGSADSGR